MIFNIIFAIVILAILFGIMGYGFYVLIVDGIKGRDGFGMLFGLFMIGMSLLFLMPICSSVYDGYQKDNSTIEIVDTKIEIVDKYYEPSYTQAINNGTTTSFIHHSEEWNIKITNGKLDKTIDNKTLYDILNVGDKVEGYINRYIQNNGDVYKEDLEIKLN